MNIAQKEYDKAIEEIKESVIDIDLQKVYIDS